MNKRISWVALGAVGLMIGCGDGGTTGGGGSTATATGAGGGGGSTSTATGTGGGTSSATTGVGGGSPGETCSACVGTKDVFKDGTACAMTLAKCNADVDCDSWFKCSQNCQTTTFTAECFAACDQSAATVSNLFQPVYDCTCAACKTECAPACK